MSLPIYNGSDELIDKLGQWMGLARELVDNRDDVITRIQAAYATYTATDLYMTSPIDSVYRQLMSAATDPAVTAAVATAVRTLVNYVNESIPLSSLTVQAALEVLEDQMILQGDTVAQSSVSATSVAQGTPVGDGLMVFPTAGQLWYAQNITAVCVQDAYTGTTSGLEVFNVTTPQAERSTFATNWGTGTGVTVRCTPLYYLGGPGQGPTIQGLANGSFDNFTASAPDSWTINTGASTISSVSGAVQGTLAMLWTGDGSTLQDLTQNLDGAIGARLLPNTSYIIGFWLKRGAVAPTGGNTIIEVVGDGGTPLTTVTVADASLTTSYQLFTGSFTTTEVLPTAPYARVAHTTGAIQSTRTITVSCAFMVEPISFGTGRGKTTLAQFLIYSGPAPFRNGDTIIGTISNNRAGEVQTWFDRFFGTARLGIVLPNSGSPTIPDAVIP